MKATCPSRTAEYTAFLRALADIGMTTAVGFSDPFAGKMLPVSFTCLHKAAGFVTSLGAGKILRFQFSPVVDLLAMRTLAIDQIIQTALNNEVGTSIEQVVILGAGLDSRAYRLPVLAGAHAFEVDHPATQEYKRTLTEALTPLTRSLTYVSVDFEKDSLDEKLLSAGFKPDRQSIWIWEGVVMYLTDGAFRGTLESIKRLSSSGSLLAAEYREPSNDKDFWQGYMNSLLKRCGEPQIGLRSEETMRRELETAGFEVVSDEGMSDWSNKFHGHSPSGFTRPARCIVGRVAG